LSGALVSKPPLRRNSFFAGGVRRARLRRRSSCWGIRHCRDESGMAVRRTLAGPSPARASSRALGGPTEPPAVKAAHSSSTATARRSSRSLDNQAAAAGVERQRSEESNRRDDSLGKDVEALRVGARGSGSNILVGFRSPGRSCDPSWNHLDFAAGCVAIGTLASGVCLESGPFLAAGAGVSPSAVAQVGPSDHRSAGSGSLSGGGAWVTR
jgi:hypothetical protein